MTKQTAFWNASQEIQLKAQTIAGSKTPKQAQQEYGIGIGYLCALYDTGIFDRDIYAAGADLLKAAYHEAEKKAAPDGSNTGNGSKGGHPTKDDGLNHNFSVDEKTPDVKTGGAYIIARSSGDGLGHLQTVGDTMALACACAAVISGLAGRLPKKFVIAAVLTGCDHAGISVDELVRAHEGVLGK